MQTQSKSVERLSLWKERDSRDSRQSNSAEEVEDDEVEDEVREEEVGERALGHQALRGRRVVRAGARVRREHRRVLRIALDPQGHGQHERGHARDEAGEERVERKRAHQQTIQHLHCACKRENNHLLL